MGATIAAPPDATSLTDVDADYSSLVGGYRAQGGLYDEMVDENGEVRAHWRPFLARLASLGAPEIARRFEAADRYLKKSGVFYRVYEDASAGERPWPLSHLPLLISAADWRTIKAGVTQRARLIEHVLADAYGPGNLVRQGHLPAAVIAGNAEFLRPVAGVVPGGEHHLTIYAVDVGRAPDGRWWVVRDRTQAPSGAGYALENRMAMTRTLSDVYRSFHIERHAPFFDAMRAALASFREPDDAGVCLLTPGPLNETYFEHAYLARYLGLRLVEGQDLTVRDQKVYLRTISGLLRVKVLLRRINSDFADPVELMGSSRSGVPGLVEAIRAGNVVLANALGSGLAEKAALLGFMPALAQCVLGEDLVCRTSPRGGADSRSNVNSCSDTPTTWR